MAKSADELEAQRGGIIAFRASPEMIADAEAAAAVEGITRSDVARRALLRDLRSQAAGSALSRLLGSDDERVPA